MTTFEKIDLDTGKKTTEKIIYKVDLEKEKAQLMEQVRLLQARIAEIDSNLITLEK